MGWRAGSSAAGSKRKQPITANDQAPTQIIGQGKVYKNAEDAVADIKSGSTILSSGFGLCGVAGELPIPTKPQRHPNNSL